MGAMPAQPQCAYLEQPTQSGASMTKKHLEALAARISEIEDLKARLFAFLAVAYVAEQFNPRFDRIKFYQSCGLVVPTGWDKVEAYCAAV